MARGVDSLYESGVKMIEMKTEWKFIIGLVVSYELEWTRKL